MKKIIALSSLLFFCTYTQAGIIKIGMIVGGFFLGQKAYNEYQIENNHPKPNVQQLEMAKTVKEKALLLAEMIEKKNDKWLSVPINQYGRTAEEFEARHPDSTKYSVLAAILFILVLFA